MYQIIRGTYRNNEEEIIGHAPSVTAARHQLGVQIYHATITASHTADKETTDRMGREISDLPAGKYYPNYRRYLEKFSPYYYEVVINDSHYPDVYFIKKA